MLVITQCMHDIEYICKNPEEFGKAMRSRGIKNFIVEEILEIDHDKRSLTTKLQDLNRKRNEVIKLVDLIINREVCENLDSSKPQGQHIFYVRTVVLAGRLSAINGVEPKVLSLNAIPKRVVESKLERKEGNESYPVF
ncbi:Serine--tRNA ligase [Dirofilaria immitis]